MLSNYSVSSKKQFLLGRGFHVSTVTSGTTQSSNRNSLDSTTNGATQGKLTTSLTRHLFNMCRNNFPVKNKTTFQKNR